MAQINVLSSQIANLIAAGEVVDRPASVAKELCENALDAGATKITVETRGGGIALLRVSDNGCGMSLDDAKKCVLRHATSKIKSEDDLTAIATLGFRGEALAAISAVSHFSIITKREADDFGYKLTFRAGELDAVEDAGCPAGTTVMVADLFYNQPARRKFLKRDVTEQAALLQYIQRIALAYPHVSFKCISEGHVKFHTPGDGRMISAIRSIYGKEVSDTLFEVDYTLDDLKVYGFVSRPEHARPTRSLQCFYVNERYVKSRTMLFATDDAFKSFLKSDRHPVTFLFLKTDYSEVDVNVHPAKLEVRFSDEKAVYRAVYAAIRSKLTELTNPFSAQKSFEPETIPPLPEAEQMRFQPLKPRPKTQEAHLASTAHTAAKDYPWASYGFKPMPTVRAVLFDPKPETEETLTPDEESKNAIPNAAPKSPAVPDPVAEEDLRDEVEENNPLKSEDGRYLGAVFHAYLLFELDETLYVIDKHAAHERILYESLRSAGPTHAQQMLLSPLIVKLDPIEATAILSSLDDLKDSGFDLSEFGEHTFALRAVPVEFSGLSEEALTATVQGFADELLRGGSVKQRRRALWDKALFTVACKAAMKAGRIDSESDCLWVIEKLRELKNIFVCPHGRPIISAFDKRSFEKLFFRA